jgi:hypothetical protein
MNLEEDDNFGDFDGDDDDLDFDGDYDRPKKKSASKKEAVPKKKTILLIGMKPTVSDRAMPSTATSKVAPSLMDTATSTTVFRTPLSIALESKNADSKMRKKMIKTVQGFRNTAPTPVQPNIVLAAKVQEISRSMLSTEMAKSAMNVGAAHLLHTTSGSCDVDSWYLPAALDAVEDAADLQNDLNCLSMTKNMAFHHGITQAKNKLEKYLAMTMCLQALSSLATSNGTPEALPSACFDCVQFHNRTGNDNHNESAGSVEIDKDMISAKPLIIQALACNRSIHFNGAVAMSVLQAVILGEGDLFCVVFLADEEITQELCPDYKPMRQVNGMYNYNAMIVYDRETANTCFATTSEQLVSTQCLLSLYKHVNSILINILLHFIINKASVLYGPFTTDCSRNMMIMPNHSWNYMRFYIFGASFADKVYGKIDFCEQSPLHMLTRKDGIKVIENVLKMNDIIPVDVILKTSKQKGGKYRMMLLSFYLICLLIKSIARFVTT